MRVRDLVADPRFRERPVTHAARLTRYAALQLGGGKAVCAVGGPDARFRFEIETAPGELDATAFVLRDRAEPALRHLTRLLRPGDRAIDCASGGGLYALAMAALTGRGGRVLALSPDAEHAEMVRRNARRNQFCQIEVLEAPLSRRERELNALGGARTAQGRGASLDEILMRLRFNRLDVARFDCRGAEQAALAGAERALRCFQPILVLNVPDPANAELRRMLNKAHYQTFVFEPSGALEPYGWARPHPTVVALGPERTTATLTA